MEIDRLLTTQSSEHKLATMDTFKLNEQQCAYGLRLGLSAKNAWQGLGKDSVWA